MDTRPGEEPIADDEILYRRVPANPSLNLYDPESDELSMDAFKPRPDDETGISVSRKKYTSLEAAAKGQSGKSYYLAELMAGALRQEGLVVKPSPLPDAPGHAEIVNLNAGNRKSDEARILKKRLATKLTRTVLGPFPSRAHGKS